ncbi:MAG: hypothetical protein JWM11_554 [Planctomycetaceae bacterium]|nr:hypothetical protein [Planctomycetaceae bacterium]
MGDVRRAAALYRAATADPAAALPQLLSGVTDLDELVRHVAAVQLALQLHSELQAPVARELLDTLLRVSQPSDRSLLTTEYAAATDDGEACWDLGQHIALSLACVPPGSADFAVPELISLWQRDRQFYEAVLAAVALTFPDGGRPLATALTELQSRVLIALTEDEAIWTFCRDTRQLLDARGLPQSRQGMRAFLDFNKTA